MLENLDVQDILSFIDGKNNISQIKRNVGMTYKTVFYKIKEMEDLGIVDFNKNKIPFIAEKYQGLVLGKIQSLKQNEKIIDSIMRDSNRKERTIKALRLLESKRWVSDVDFNMIVFNDYNDFTPEMVQFVATLRSAGIIRRHPEITIRGKNFLKQNK